jgi:Type II CAAX prenyl endopeptidase Rce1-like
VSRWLDFVLFLIIATVVSIAWGRVNRIGYTKAVTSVVRFFMKYSKMNTSLIQSYLVWFIYMAFGLTAAVALLAAYQVSDRPFIELDPRYLPVVPLAFIAETSLTGLMIQLALLARPAVDVFSELTSILWVRFTLIMPGVMRMVSPLCAAMIEEVFFRGAVFLTLLRSFPWVGPYWSMVVCTALFVVQQVLQTDTLGQGLIFLVGSTSISVVGCITILYTGSFLPTLLCHAAYAAVYLQLGTSAPAGKPIRQRSRPSSAYPSF